jgi:hypothetical protein
VLERHVRHRGHGAAAAALLVVVFAGCGGDGGNETSGVTSATVADTLPASTQPGTKQDAGAGAGTDRLLITESIDAVFTSGDPAKACEAYVTQAYVEKAFGDLEGCRAAQVPAAAASSVDVSAVRVGAESATADASPRGGPSSGETVHVSLVYEDAAWRVDSLKSDVPVGP